MIGLYRGMAGHDIYHDVRCQIAPEAESLMENNAIDPDSYKLLFEGAKPGTKSK